MDIFKEVKLYLTTLHPALKLGNESLKRIKFTKSNIAKNIGKNKALAIVVSITPRNIPITTVSYDQRVEQKPLTESFPKKIDDKPSNKAISQKNHARSIIKVEGEDRVLPTNKTFIQYSISDSLHLEKAAISLKQKEKALKKKQIINSGSKYTQVKIESFLNLSIPQKRLRNQDCPCCEWEFPKSFTEEKCNQHVNMCVDGKGSEDVDMYKKSLSAVKTTQYSDVEKDLKRRD